MEEALMIQETGELYSMDRLAITPVMDLALAKKRLYEFQQFVKEYLVEGEDFGTIPGVAKPSLFKPGADKLCELYGLADEYEVVQRTEDWDRGLFDYEVKCRLTSKRSGSLVSTGMGSCNSYEGKYRWRNANRVCPQCGKETIIKGKDEYGGGWLCFGKKGGCGAKWPEGAKAIESQVVGRIQNEDIADVKNTILKMAKKRAKIDATLAATRSSGIFTQDVEDMNLAPPEEPPAPTTQTPEQQPHKPKNGTTKTSVITCADCKKPVTDYGLDGGKTMPADDVLKFARKKYSADLCGNCLVKRRDSNGKPAATTVEGESFVPTKFEKIPDDSAIEVTGLVRKVSLSPDSKRLIVAFDDQKEVYSFHKGETRKLLESKAIGKTCVFFCDESKYGLEFKNVVSIDGVDASLVQFGVDESDMPA
jgi:hypothetical protein